MDKVLPWLSLKSVPGIGNHLFKKLLEKFGTPESVLSASQKKLLEVEGISQNLAATLCKHEISDSVKQEVDLAIQKRIKIVTMSDENYPALLHQLPDPPPYLYVLGNLDNRINNIAVVGSRNATEYGLSTTLRLCKDIVSFQLTVVSGMARGIDTAAHKGAILGNGRTVAILGSGLGKVYPAENEALFYQIAENGAVISEFPVMAGPEPYHFPIRNRVISGMSLGTVVVEATKRSGSLITARLSAEQGREVFAVPGSVSSFKSTGTHGLIKQGAKLVENAQDIIEELSPLLDFRDSVNSTERKKIKTQHLPLSSEELPVYEALEPYPMHIDDIMRKVCMEPGKLAGILLKLELQGIVKQSPGKLFYISEE